MDATFLDTLNLEVGALQAQHPILAEVIARGHALLMDGKVFPLEDGRTAEVGSSTDPAMAYLVNGSCPCKASEYRPEPCKHRMAKRLYERVCERLDEEQECYSID